MVENVQDECCVDYNGYSSIIHSEFFFGALMTYIHTGIERNLCYILRAFVSLSGMLNNQSLKKGKVLR